MSDDREQPGTSEEHDPWAFMDQQTPEASRPAEEQTAPYRAATPPPAPAPAPAPPSASTWETAPPPVAPRTDFYASPPPAHASYGPAPHPSAGTAMVLSLVGLIGGLLCAGLPLVVSPFAWAMGSRALREIDASPGTYSGREQAMTAKVCGIIGTILLVLGLILLVVVIAVFVMAFQGAMVTSSSSGVGVDF